MGMGVLLNSSRLTYRHFINGFDMLHMTTQGAIVAFPQCKFNRCDQSWCWHIAKRLRWHVQDVDHDGNPTARPNIRLCTTTRNVGQ